MFAVTCGGDESVLPGLHELGDPPPSPSKERPDAFDPHSVHRLGTHAAAVPRPGRPRGDRRHRGRGLLHRRRRPELPRLGHDLRDDPGRLAARRTTSSPTSSGTSCGPAAPSSTAAATPPASPTTRPAGTPPSPSTSGPPPSAAPSSSSPHDLWGADGTTSQCLPGDNGDWTQFDAFVTRLITDVQANHMTVQWDMWNEPDGSGFWGASQSPVPADVVALLRRSPADVPQPAHRRAQHRRPAQLRQRLVDGLPRLRQGQQRRPRHLQLARRARRPGRPTSAAPTPPSPRPD